MSDRSVRPNLQVDQSFKGNIENDKNGWPTDLSDQSSPLKMVVTNGQSGSQRNFDPTSTSRQNELSLTEGRPGTGQNSPQGPNSNKLKTSQQNAGDISDPGGN